MNCWFYLNVWRVCALLFYCTGYINLAECKLCVYSIIYNTTDSIFLSLYVAGCISGLLLLNQQCKSFETFWDLLSFLSDGFLIFVFKNLGIVFSFLICLNSIKVKEAGIRWLCDLLRWFIIIVTLDQSRFHDTDQPPKTLWCQSETTSLHSNINNNE